MSGPCGLPGLLCLDNGMSFSKMHIWSMMGESSGPGVGSQTFLNNSTAA